MERPPYAAETIKVGGYVLSELTNTLPGHPPYVTGVPILLLGFAPQRLTYGNSVPLGTVPLKKNSSYQGTIGINYRGGKATLGDSRQVMSWSLTVKDCKVKLDSITLKETGINRGAGPGGTDQLGDGRITISQVLRLVDSNYLPGPFDPPFPTKTGPTDYGR